MNFQGLGPRFVTLALPELFLACCSFVLLGFVVTAISVTGEVSISTLFSFCLCVVQPQSCTDDSNKQLFYTELDIYH